MACRLDSIAANHEDPRLRHLGDLTRWRLIAAGAGIVLIIAFAVC